MLLSLSLPLFLSALEYQAHELLLVTCSLSMPALNSQASVKSLEGETVEADVCSQIVCACSLPMV